MTTMIDSYGIKNGQTYLRADGSKSYLTVIDCEAFASCDDVLVEEGGVKNPKQYRIDAFKLTQVRYYLKPDAENSATLTTDAGLR